MDPLNIYRLGRPPLFTIRVFNASILLHRKAKHSTRRVGVMASVPSGGIKSTEGIYGALSTRFLNPTAGIIWGPYKRPAIIQHDA